MIVKRYKKKKLGSYPYLSVILSTSTALFIVGLFFLLVIQAKTLSRVVKSNFEIQVFLQNTADQNQQKKIKKEILEKPYILKDTDKNIRYVSKEDAAQELTQELGEDFRELLGENPLKDAYNVKIDPDYYSPEEIVKIKKDIESIEGVFEVSYAKNMMSEINQNIATISFVLFTFVLLMIIIIIILIDNAIKLALFSQRMIIRSMQLVGATAAFVRKPFLRSAAVHGLISGGIACLLLFGLMKYIESSIKELAVLHHTSSVIMLFFGLIVLGILLSVISSLRAVNRYLNMSLDDLY